MVSASIIFITLKRRKTLSVSAPLRLSEQEKIFALFFLLGVAVLPHPLSPQWQMTVKLDWMSAVGGSHDHRLEECKQWLGLLTGSLNIKVDNIQTETKSCM